MEYMEPGARFIGVVNTLGGAFEDEYYEYQNAAELAEAIKDLGGHDMGDSELDSMSDDEEFSLEVEAVVKAKAAKASTAATVKKVAAKKAPTKKAAPKKAAPKVAAKPKAKVAAKKSPTKTVKKPALKAAK